LAWRKPCPAPWLGVGESGASEKPGNTTLPGDRLRKVRVASHLPSQVGPGLRPIYLNAGETPALPGGARRHLSGSRQPTMTARVREPGGCRRGRPSRPRTAAPRYNSVPVQICPRPYRHEADPAAPSGAGLQRPWKALDSLQGKVVAFIDNSKPNFNLLARDLGELLLSQYGVKSVIQKRKRSVATSAPDEMLDELARECDLVITGSGD